MLLWQTLIWGRSGLSCTGRLHLNRLPILDEDPWHTISMGTHRDSPPRSAVISRYRKILCIAILAAACLAAPAQSASAEGLPGEPGLLRATLHQTDRQLIFTVRTAKPVGLARLNPMPDLTSSDGFLCLLLRRAGHSNEKRLCLGGPSNVHRRTGLLLINAAGQTTSEETVVARLKRPSPTKLALSILPEAAGLSPHRYSWRVLERRPACRPTGAAACEEALPASGFFAFRLRPVRAVGCTGGTTGLLYNGPRDRKVVALTFDDGPSEYTEGFLDVLREKHVHGTFFEIGQEAAGREATMRRILREGSEIGNHTTHHSAYPGYEDLATTNGLIRTATHFEPCLFRPPDGAVNAAVVDAAGQAGLKTILWDVDPTDWAMPGSNAVYSRVVDATQPGSIILMHDGGGDRSGTLAALPQIIDTLRGRGYRFATVSELLGDQMTYKPYG
jgi:peptidoglycan/xylan/chitin deacetylase (PgdA/CDA1 family)